MKSGYIGEINSRIQLLIFSCKDNNLQIFFEYPDEIKTQKFLLLSVGLNQWHTSVDVWSGDRLVRRGSLVQTPLKGAKISAF